MDKWYKILDGGPWVMHTWDILRLYESLWQSPAQKTDKKPRKLWDIWEHFEVGDIITK